MHIAQWWTCHDIPYRTPFSYLSFNHEGAYFLHQDQATVLVGVNELGTRSYCFFHVAGWLHAHTWHKMEYDTRETRRMVSLTQNVFSVHGKVSSNLT